jgi:hypothetical protein
VASSGRQRGQPTGPRYAPMSSPSPQEIAALKARIEAAERALDQLFAKTLALIAHALSMLDRLADG